MALPNPGMDAVPFTPLTAEFLDDMIENIESLSDGTGFENGAITTNTLADNGVTGSKVDFGTFIARQYDTTNSNPNNVKIQYGWGRIAGAAATNISESVTFPTPYTSLPVVLVTAGGGVTTGGGSGAYPGTSTSYMDNMQAGANNESTTGFQVTITRQGANFTVGHTLFYTWVAFGT